MSMSFSLRRLFVVTAFIAAVCAATAHFYNAPDWDMSWDEVQYWYFYDRPYLERSIISLAQGLITTLFGSLVVWLLIASWKEGQVFFWVTLVALSSVGMAVGFAWSL
jgi:hypothetical protein